MGRGYHALLSDRTTLCLSFASNELQTRDIRENVTRLTRSDEITEIGWVPGKGSVETCLNSMKKLFLFFQKIDFSSQDRLF